MQLPDALTLTRRLIYTGEKHQDYQRTVELAEDYRIFITGKDIDKKLRPFVQREDDALFQQRLRLTKSITPAVASSIRTPFSKVTRNDRIRKAVKTTAGTGRDELIATMQKGFYGSRRKKNRGLDYWMKTRFTELQFIDPNTWIVVEWDTPADLATRVQPKPFEVPADQAVNFLVVNDETKWLFIQQPIRYKAGKVETTNGNTNSNPNKAAGVITPAGNAKKDGFRWTLYDEDVTVVFEQADPDFLKTYTLQEGEATEVINEQTFIVRTYTPNLSYPPVIRIGYKRDDVTKARTFVNPWHDALCFFEKTLKTVSELDLTMTLHTFPQKFQYVQKCLGMSREQKCNGGRTMDGKECGACKGTGFKVHTTAQDAVLLPMPSTKEDMLDLNGLMVYKTPPIELIKFQNEYTQQLERQAHQAVFNSQVFVKKAGSPGATGQPIQTATEADYNMESVYDALDPFTEKYSETWREFTILFGGLAGEKPEVIDVTHEFLDYKLKTSSMLQSERKVAVDSGAPAFIIEAIDDDLANQVFAGDELAMVKYRVKRRYYPFIGKSPEETADAAASEFVPKASKVLYYNFEAIFRELELADPKFYFMVSIPQQKKLVDAKVQEYVDMLTAEKPVLQLNPLGSTNPIGEGAAGGSDNPGSDTPGNDDETANTDNNGKGDSAGG